MTIIVDTINDAIDPNDGVTSLREAIEEANKTSGLDTIEFDETKLSGKEITLKSGELEIKDDLTINGLGTDKLTVSGNKKSRVFKVDDGDSGNLIDVVIDGLTIADGLTDEKGGGIFSFENLMVSNSTISGNTAETDGGGIYNKYGNLMVSNSTISGNTAKTNGGGINKKDIDPASDLEVSDSTIFDNTAKQAGGVFNGGQPAVVGNTIIAGNTGTNPDVSGEFISKGFNLIGDGTGSIGFTKKGDRVGIDLVTVDTLVDENDGDLSPGDVSLREALGFVSPGGTIDFDPNLASVDAGAGKGTIGLTLGRLSIDKDLTINGLGADKLTVSGSSNSSVLLVNDGISDNLIQVEIDGLTIADGKLPSVNATGAGIRNDENLELSDVIVRNNNGGSRGTGIGNSGFLKISESVIKENSNDFRGGVGGAGGIANFSGATLEIERSTISDNSSAKNGGGIINSGGILRIKNSTISGNKINAAATGFGGAGIFNTFDGTLSINNSTVSNNEILLNRDSNDSTFIGGGIRTNSGLVSVANTIVGDNTISDSGNVTRSDVLGSFNSNGYNLIEDGTGSNGFNGTGDQVGTTTDPIDPLIGPLQDNGGPTETQALLSGSPAIDMGNPDFEPPPYFDQRGSGFPRVLDGDGDRSSIIDIGAFELAPEFNMIDGNARNNRLVGTRNSDRLSGFGRNDRLLARGGDDFLDGGGGRDRLNGGAGNDRLDGGRGSDRLFGDRDNDILDGGDNRDRLDGGQGDDLLDGGRGSDRLKGDRGADGFVLREGDGRDIILDYRDGQDRFLLADGLAFDELTITQGRGETSISVTDTNEELASLIGVQANLIGSEDFTTLV